MKPCDIGCSFSLLSFRVRVRVSSCGPGRFRVLVRLRGKSCFALVFIFTSLAAVAVAAAASASVYSLVPPSCLEIKKQKMTKLSMSKPRDWLAIIQASSSMPEIQTPTLHAHHKPITTPPLTMPKCNIQVAGWQLNLEIQVISMEEEGISLQCMSEQGITLHRTPELIEESCAEHAGQLRRFFLRSGIFFPPFF